MRREVLPARRRKLGVVLIVATLVAIGELASPYAAHDCHRTRLDGQLRMYPLPGRHR